MSLSIFDYLSKNKKSDICIFSFIGSFYSNSYLPHRVPSRFEMMNGFWGMNNFLVQDQISKTELESSLKNKKVNFHVSESRLGLKRFNDTKKITSNKLNTKFKRIYTYFSEGSYFEIYIVLFRFFNHPKLLFYIPPMR